MQKHLAQLLLLSSLSLSSFAQNTRVLRDSGLKKLSAFLGTWHAQGSGAADKNISANYTCQWSVNGKFLVADQLVNNNGTITNNLSIYSYNPATDDYTLSLIGIPGMQPFTIPVAYSRDTLIYHSENTENGKKTYNRTLNIFFSTSHYKYVVQSSADGLNWTTNGEGEAQKTKTL
jgi:hypothetical protein